MLTNEVIEQVLCRAPKLTIGLVGDLFLDRYLDIDAELTEPSLETGLDAYQVVRVRSYPGALGTVLNNLVGLRVGKVVPITLIGDDGEGYELRQWLTQHPAVDQSAVFSTIERRTPTYTKPMLNCSGQMPRELNRLDIKNRTPTPERDQKRIREALHSRWNEFDAVLVLDQVSEAECGVITTSVREAIAELTRNDPAKFILADSRERIDFFCEVSVKPNLSECARASGLETTSEKADDLVRWLAERNRRPVFCTVGSAGIILADPVPRLIPAYPVSGPIDAVGAGDSTSAGIACAVAAGLSFNQAAAFGNLVASITIQQIGTTGTASPDQVRERWRVVESLERGS